LRLTGNYATYRDVFIIQKLQAGKNVIKVIRPEFRQAAKQKFIEMIGEEEMDYLKNRATPQERDYCFSLLGHRVAWCRYHLCQFSRSIIRGVGVYFFSLLRKKYPKQFDNKPSYNEQLVDLVFLLSRELVEFKAFSPSETTK
jgi:hypothetical protein